MDPPFELMLTDSEMKLPEGTAVALTAPTLISPLAFKITEEKLLLEFADTDVALSAVFELIVIEEPNVLVAATIRLAELSTAAEIDPFVAVNDTLPVVSMVLLKTDVPVSETPPPAALMPPNVLTELVFEVIATGPPVVLIRPKICTKLGAVAVKLPLST